jgi:hypothetical protein
VGPLAIAGAGRLIDTFLIDPDPAGDAELVADKAGGIAML